jgi:hypothetical protein
MPARKGTPVHKVTITADISVINVLLRLAVQADPAGVFLRESIADISKQVQEQLTIKARGRNEKKKPKR